MVGYPTWQFVGNERSGYLVLEESGKVTRMVSALASFNPRLRDLPEHLPFVWDPATLRNAAILTLSTELGAMDLLAEVTGLGGSRK